jgi:hypothetical protein
MQLFSRQSSFLTVANLIIIIQFSIFYFLRSKPDFFGHFKDILSQLIKKNVNFLKNEPN